MTAEGRIVATVLMAAGVALFGVLSAFLAAWFLETGQAKDSSELAALREEVRALREVVERSQAGIGV